MNGSGFAVVFMSTRSIRSQYVCAGDIYNLRAKSPFKAKKRPLIWFKHNISNNTTRSDPFARLFIMGPHPNNFHGFDVVKNLIHKPMLDVDSPGARPGKIADKLLVGWWRFVGIVGQEIKKLLCVAFQPRARQFLGVALCLCRINQRPAHQSSFLAHLSTGVFKPLRIDSRMSGIEVR